MCLENLVSDSFLFNVGFRHHILAQKSSLVSGNWPGENSLITHSPAQSNVYQNRYFWFQKANIKEKKKKKQKKKKKKKKKKKQKQKKKEKKKE